MNTYLASCVLPLPQPRPPPPPLPPLPAPSKSGRLLSILSSGLPSGGASWSAQASVGASAVSCPRLCPTAIWHFQALVTICSERFFCLSIFCLLNSLQVFVKTEATSTLTAAFRSLTPGQKPVLWFFSGPTTGLYQGSAWKSDGESLPSPYQTHIISLPTPYPWLVKLLQVFIFAAKGSLHGGSLYQDP